MTLALTEATPDAGTRRPRGLTILLAAAIVLAALNLRTAVTSIGPLLGEVQAALGMSGTLAGVLTTLPVLCFAAFGALTPILARRFGEHPVLLCALFAITAGIAVRPLVGSAIPFLLVSAFALAGGAAGNVLIPTLVKRHFPHRVGALTTAYTTAMAAGTTLVAAGTGPVERMSGDWRLGLGVWAAFGVVAVLPWLALLRHRASTPYGTAGAGAPGTADAPGETRTVPATIGLRGLLHSRTAWLIAGYFGTQSTVAYILFGWYAEILKSAGFSPSAAGLLLAVLTAMGVPVNLLVPLLIAKAGGVRVWMIVLGLSYLGGFGGLALAPTAATWLWTLLIGFGMGTFPLALMLFALRARTAEGTAALSAFTQSLGYLVAGAGPLLVGVLFEATGGWAAPFALIFATVLTQLAIGWFAGRDRYLEDDLR
ncbi:MAG: MFS transporter [Streptosporangiales bacterium]|nr:MFS transporter [Streptosporangiales bacterium]